MISSNKILFLLIWSLGLNITMQAQTVYYYQLTKTKINGKVTTQNSGGQFICIYDNFCYDSDKRGKGVGNGQLHLKNKGEYITYYGESFFGKNTYYKFNGNYSSLNIITPKGDIYAYKKVTPPSNVLTCSLIKNRSNSSPSLIETPIYTEVPSINNNNRLPNNQKESRQKTKVRKKCAFCTGGERIQHEYVSTSGTKGPKVYCSKCNKSWSYGTVHHHHTCNHCGGTGYYEYEY